MIRPNYRDFRRPSGLIDGIAEIQHSAKGSTWEKHKYIKRVDGTYYYPDSYKGGRHLPDSKNKSEETKKKKTKASESSSEESDIQTISKKEGTSTDGTKETIGRKGESSETATIVNRKDGTSGDKEVATITNKENTKTLSENMVESLAKEVINGQYGNGVERKELLGDAYGPVQRKVNEILLGSSGDEKVIEIRKEIITTITDYADRISQKIPSTSNSKNQKESKVRSGVDMDVVQQVYRKGKDEKRSGRKG